MAVHQAFGVLGDAHNNCGFALLAVGVMDFMFVTEVNKSKAVKTEVASVDKANVLLTASVVEVDQVGLIVVVGGHHAVEIASDELDRGVLAG